MRYCVVAAVCGLTSWIITNTPAKHATSLILDHATQFFMYFVNVIIPYCIYIMFHHIFIEYLELPKWLYTQIHYSVDSIVVTLLYCTTLYVFFIWLHLTISTCTRKWINGKWWWWWWWWCVTIDPALIVEPWGKKFTSRMPFLSQNTVHMIFRVEVVCLNFIFVGDEVCCFDSGVACNTHVLSLVTKWLKKLPPSSLYHVRKSNALACRFNLCSSISIFGTQRAHNFQNSSSSDTISWRSDREIWGKCRESDVIVNRLFCLIFSSTACTKSSFTTDGRPLRVSSCTFSRASLNIHTHLHTIELLMACSPYTSQSWWWISAGFTIFAFKKRITDHISHAAGFSIS